MTEQTNTKFIKVFLSPETKNAFKVKCAKEDVPMSEKARQLIENWVQKDGSE
ncbi:hypothetical protein [Dolichospermum sp. UHCC 0259]|uniref:hypothetical protein n=1 Tax=Dolichospermum sp. UHCC 0259 TaxID=2590010 RepID=UPI0014452CEC|nr:hypothetical protein [Dolichospermum sp. UHCC 0259]